MKKGETEKKEIINYTGGFDGNYLKECILDVTIARKNLTLLMQNTKKKKLSFVV